MNIHQQKRIPAKTMLLVSAAAILVVSCHKIDIPGPKELRNFKQVNLVANTSQYQPRTIDPTLQNGFGIAWSPTGIAWVNSVAGHVSELYKSEGEIVRAPVNVPSPTDTIGGLPTGIVFSGGKGFNLSNGPANFIFSAFDGVISAWNSGSGNNAVRLQGPANEHTSYSGLAIGSNGGMNYIYAANFGEKKIEVWDTTFTAVSMAFTDPDLAADYSPYNIQAIGNWLYVVYAKLGSDGHGVAGNGNGYVSVFGMDGSFVKHFASKGTLNVPWGITEAPGNFLDDDDMDDDNGHSGADDSNDDSGHHSSEPVILVGNFGDGRINVFDENGNYKGQLRSGSQPIVINGLWALSFAPTTATTIDPKRLYFSAGPGYEKDGLFGYLIKE